MGGSEVIRAVSLKEILGLLPVFPFFVSQLSWGKQLPPPHVPTMMLSLTTGPKAIGPVSHELKPLESWAKITLSSLKLYFLRHFVTVTKQTNTVVSILIQFYTAYCGHIKLFLGVDFAHILWLPKVTFLFSLAGKVGFFHLHCIYFFCWLDFCQVYERRKNKYQ